MRKDSTTIISDEQITKYLVGHKSESGIYVGRPTQFGNPFRLKKDGGDYTREESVRAYEEWLIEKIRNDEEFRRDVRKLAGEKLTCWCQYSGDTKPACHAEVLAKHALYLANRE